MEQKRNCGGHLKWFSIVVQIFLLAQCAASRWRGVGKNESDDGTYYPPVQLHDLKDHVVLDNGILNVTLSTPEGMITGISYNGVDNLLEYRKRNRGYWDIVWSKPDYHEDDNLDKLEGTNLFVLREDDDQVELSFVRTWSPSETGLPLNIDKRFILLRGVSGFYTYAIFEHLKGWPGLRIDEARVAFKLQKKMFNYMAISDDKQRIMPTTEDRKSGQVLEYGEAVLLTNPSNPSLKGEVDDKYQYSCENKDSHVHGWISSNPCVGFWIITPSDEFRAGGPTKPDLASHTGPTSLSIFFSNHYAGPRFGVLLRDGEEWKKVYGPILIYLNSDSGSGTTTLWKNAKEQMEAEAQKWPYDFPSSPDFPHPNQRGSISGRLLVNDPYIDRAVKPARSAYVILAPPGEVGSWQDNYKGYLFWTQNNDQNGGFTIRGIRPGTYNLYAWVPGIIGDFKHDGDVIIKPGSEVKMGDLVYAPPRNGPTQWEIGIPDRTAAEFYVPDPYPNLINRLYINSTKNKFRQYGLWDKYTDLYPKQDLVYTAGVSNYAKDWFFAHVTRRAEKTCIPTTWQIKFDLKNVIKKGDYTLRIALAAAHNAKLKVWINKPNTPMPLFTTGRIGLENAIARHGVHGRYWLFNVKIPGLQLVNGRNTIYVKQAIAGSPFAGVLYDYIRLESPSQKV